MYFLVKASPKPLVLATSNYARVYWLGAKVHVTLCVDLYSGRIIVFFYDLDDSLCCVTCVIVLWT